MNVTGKESRLLDQFFTRQDVAESLINDLFDREESQWDAVLEPAVGKGAFLVGPVLTLPCIYMDIDSTDEHARRDFLTTDASILKTYKRVLALGNPPFGKNSSLAVKFFNHAATMAAVDTIAFIVPLTFHKESLKRRLNPAFSLVQEVELPKDAFVFDDKPKHVPSVFQVWRRTENDTPMEPPSPMAHPDFFFCKSPADADFAVQRVGAQAGKITTNQFAHKSPNSHYFIKARHDTEQCLARMQQADLENATCKLFTAGNPSLSKRELIRLYTGGRE